MRTGVTSTMMGAITSATRFKVEAERLLFPATSRPTPERIATVIAPSVIGVILKVYPLPIQRKFVRVAFVRVTPVLVNPRTDSENCTATPNVPFTGDHDHVVIVVVGAVASTVNVPRFRVFEIFPEGSMTFMVQFE